MKNYYEDRPVEMLMNMEWKDFFLGVFTGTVVTFTVMVMLGLYYG